MLPVVKLFQVGASYKHVHVGLVQIHPIIYSLGGSDVHE